jgi:hypothetical protein
MRGRRCAVATQAFVPSRGVEGADRLARDEPAADILADVLSRIARRSFECSNGHSRSDDGMFGTDLSIWQPSSRRTDRGRTVGNELDIGPHGGFHPTPRRFARQLEIVFHLSPA